MNNKKGLTILEIIVALGVSVFMMDAIYSVLLKGISVLNNLCADQMACALAEDQMEIVCSAFSSQQASGNLGFSPEIARRLDSLGRWSGFIKISDYQSRKGLKMIEVSLSWQSGKRQRKIVLTTLKK